MSSPARRIVLGPAIGLVTGFPLASASAAVQTPVRVPAAPTASASAYAPLVIQDVTVIDVRDGRRLPHQAVVVANRRIQAFGNAAVLRRPAGARVVNGRGKYLIPGLWDMHYHAVALEVAYPLLIANGITGIREPGGRMSLDTLRWWRQEIAAGRRVGPRQPVILGSMYPDPDTAMTPADARRIIDSTKAAGAEFFKLHAFNGPSRDAYFAMLAEARRIGLPVVGHLPFRVTAVEASDSGQRTLEHLMWDIAIGSRSRSCPADSLGVGSCAMVHFPRGHMLGLCDGDSATIETCGALAQRFRRNGTWWVPTLTFHYYPFHDPPYRPILSRLPYLPDSLRRMAARPFPVEEGSGGRRVDVDSAFGAVVGLMARAGMPLLAGTDVLLYATVHEELAVLVEKGLTPLAALQAATLNPAQYLGITDSLGTIGPGQLADLVLLDADPLVDIRNTAQIRAVVANGRYFDRAALDALLADVERRVRTENILDK